MKCSNEKWVKLIYDNGKVLNLMDKDDFEFINAEKYQVNGNTFIQEISGVDGALMGSTTFGPFELKLHFRYTGSNSMDMDLFCFELENDIQSRTPYYLNHSKMPSIKYLVAPTPKVEYNPITIRHCDFTITFTCNKGYSESLYETDQYNDEEEIWQYLCGIYLEDDVQYKHTTKNFKIYNGSADKVSPFPHRHKLIIKINIDAPKGFKLINKTTGDTFEYKKSIKYNETLLLNGTRTFIGDKSVGINTNHEYISLEKGFNDFEVLGKEIRDLNIEFVFPFIFR